MSADEPTARLTIVRRSPSDIKSRQVDASLDGQPFTSLLFGESESKNIPAGRHVLRITNKLVWKTIEFDASASEEIRFSVINRPGWATWWLLAILGVGPVYLTVTRES